MKLQVELLEKENVHCFKVKGEIDAFTAPLLKERLASIQNLNDLQVELDLSEVEYIDSTGLGVFVGFFKKLKDNNGYMKITGASNRIKRLFEITGLDQIIDVEAMEGGNRDAAI